MLSHTQHTQSCNAALLVVYLIGRTLLFPLQVEIVFLVLYFLIKVAAADVTLSFLSEPDFLE